MKKRDYIFLIAPVLLFSSVLFFFGPMQLYLANITELWFGFGDELWPSLVIWIVSAAFMLALGMLLRRNDKVFKAYCLLLFGLGVALYVQGNYIPFNYGIMNGVSIDWSRYTGQIISSIVIWTVILAVPFILNFFLRERIKSLVAAISGGLILVQLIAIGTQLFMTDLTKTATQNFIYTTDGLYDLSDDQNVVIFVLDTFDQKVFQSIQDNSPEKTDFLDGFTFYSNMTCAYPQTKGSMPFILTGKYYENREPYTEYVKQAWEDASYYYDALVEKNYQIDIYSEDLFISDAAIEKWVNNCVHEKVVVSSPLLLERDMLRLTLMRYMPDALKKYIWSHDTLFIDAMSASDDEYSMYSWQIKDFSSELVQHGLNLVHDKKKYSLIHLDGTHPPFTLKEDFSEDPENSSIEDEALCNLAMLREYFRQMQELGVYDNSLIIITGDHGYNVAKSNPIMFVKGLNERHSLTWDDSPVSHYNLFGTVMSALGLNEDHKYGLSVNETKGSTEFRRYMLYSWSAAWDKDYLPDMTEYHILPGGNTDEYYTPTGYVFSSEGVFSEIPYSYQLGSHLLFGDKSNTAHFLNGIAAFSDTYTDANGEVGYYNWSIGHEADACFNLGEIEDNLYCNIRLHAWVPKDAQHVIISSNGRVMYDGIVTSEASFINFFVPKECVTGGMLNLHFEYPDACSTSSYMPTSTDERIIAIAFEEIVIDEISDTKHIDFSESGNAGNFLVSGWHAQEENWRWTDEKAAIQVFGSSEVDRQMTVSYWTHPGAKDTEVFLNDNYLGTLPHHEKDERDKPEMLSIPKDYWNDTGNQILTFRTIGATTSKDFYGGDETDTRILGIAVSEIDI